MNEIADASRKRKVIAIVAAIDARFRRQNPTLDPFDQAGRIWLATASWPDAVWLQVAQAAGYKSKKAPRETTRVLVREIYEGRAKAPLAKRAAS